MARLGEESLDPSPENHQRRFAVIGDPIAHSLSPLLHQSAYRALGISDARYERIRVPREGFAAFSRDVLPGLEGVSVTMPHKSNAHALASTHDSYGSMGICNTLIPIAGGRGARSSWAGFNTDVYGIRCALASEGMSGTDTATIFGSGATAMSLAAALLEIGCERFTLCARSESKTRDLGTWIETQGGRIAYVPWDQPERACDSRVVGSALASPGAAVLAERLLPHVEELTTSTTFFDVLYHPDPTPLMTVQRAIAADVGPSKAPRFATGAQMLTHQAAKQVELMLEVAEGPADLMYAEVFSTI